MQLRRAPRYLWLSLSLLWAACSGGGSGSSPDTLVEFSSSTSSGVEGGPAVGVGVRLITRLPELAKAVIVLVRSAGTGSAVNGIDVAPLADHEFVFPAGSHDGDEQVMWVTPLDDDLIEGASETLRLELEYDSGPAAIGPRRSHSVTIADADFATLRFHTVASATFDESTQAAPVQVELDLPPGVLLACPLHARVSDAGTGTASAGHDYASFAPVTVSFPAGSPSGALSEVDLSVLQDNAVEGDESVVLALGSPGPDVELGNPPEHTLTITDDDTVEPPQLTVSDENGAPLSSGAPVDLGSQLSGLGPNAGVFVEVESSGPSPLALALPLIDGPDERDFEVELETGSLGSAGDFAAARPSPLRRVAEDARLGATLELDLAAVADSAAQSHVVWTDFPLPGRGDAALVLERLPSPWASDARIELDGQALEQTPAELLGDLTLWSGTLLGDEGARVFLALSPSGARGWIEGSQLGGPTVVIEPLLDDPGRSIAIDTSQVAALGIRVPSDFCSDAPAVPESEALPNAAAATSGASLAHCRIALESDFQLFQRLGGASSLTEYVSALVAASSARYRIDVQTELEIAYLGIHSQPNDGWSTPDHPGTTTQMLDEFRTAWSPTLGSGWPAPANLAHFLSGANLGGGIAYLGVICNPNWGFGVSGDLNGAIDWSSWTGAASPLTWDFVVFSHELGHNFSAAHTHAYCPPLDKCATNCTGATACSVGTLMSYCHLCAGGLSNIQLVFHPFVANVMRSAVNNSCLGDASLAPGQRVRWRLRFAPSAGGGVRHATLAFDHDADNAPTPFTLELRGTAIP